MSGTTDVLFLAESAGNTLGRFEYWDGVLVAGCALAGQVHGSGVSAFR